MTPSKELVSEVLRPEICTGVELSGDDLKIWLFQNGEECKTWINIYEFAHKCKEWAITKKGIKLNSFESRYCYSYCEIWEELNENPYEIIKATTEQEAIFKACEWIMEQIK